MGDNVTQQNIFLDIIKGLKNPAVLLKREEDGTLLTVFVSEMYAKMMECSIEEAMAHSDGKRFLSTTHQDDRVFVKRMLRRRAGEDGTQELTIRKYTAKGKLIWCRVCFSFIDDYADKYVYCTYSDVTALKDYEEQLHIAYMNMGDSFYHSGQKTLSMLRVDLTTDAVEDIRGRDMFGTDSMAYHYSELLERRSVHYPVFEERQRLMDSFSREALIDDFSDGKTKISEIIYSKRSMGNFCYVKVTANITRHPLNGNIIAFITEEECNDEKVNETLTDKILIKQFDMVSYLSNGKYGVIIGDPDNIGEGSIFPITRTGEYRHYLENQVFPVLSGSEEKKNAMAKALLPETVEKEIINNNPYVVNVAVNIEGKNFYKRFDFYLADPETKFYVLLKSDTTEMHREQVEFNKQLVFALDDAEKANMAKMAFLSRMSSELMVPMKSIISLDETALKESDLTPAVKRELDEIGVSARHLLSLIKDILDMSSIESGIMKLEKKEFSYKQLLDDINEDACRRCEKKGITYESYTKGEMSDSFFGDVTKLKQIIMNIIDNAVKYTDEGGRVTLEVHQTAGFENKALLQFMVRDTGIGIEEEHLSKIFDPFSKVSDETEGSGLGLSIASSIADMMDGNIYVSSKPGSGSAFAVEVTLENDTGEDGQESDEDRERILSGKRILLAEDMVVNAEMMMQVLSAVGVEVAYAANGREALEMFEDSGMDHYDAILMDIRMPVMDGLEAAEAIRALDRVDAKDVPIIALTANAYYEDEKKSAKVGMNAHLSKPAEPYVLYKTLAKLIGEREKNYI